MKRSMECRRHCCRWGFLPVLALAVCAAPRASAQVLVDAGNSAIGASSSAPDPAHFQNAGSTTDRAIYVGYDGVNGIGYMDNTGELIADGANTGSGIFDITENWGIGVGIFPGGEGYFINSGAGTVNSLGEIRVGDGFDGFSHGEFYQESSGAVTAGDYLTVGNFGGTGKFFQSGTGAVDVGFELWIGVGTDSGGAAVSSGEYVISNSAAQTNVAVHAYVGRGGGTGTFTQEDGGVTVGVAGMEETLVPELYVGFGGGATGEYDLQDGTLTVNGWSNIGRDGGTGVFNNSGTFITTRELRIGANYSLTPGGNGTVNNLAGGVIEAQSMWIGIVDLDGTSSEGHLSNGEDGTVHVSTWTYVGPSGQGTLDMDGGAYTTDDNFSIGLNASGIGVVDMTGGVVTVVGNAPAYTGNFLVGRDGSGTLNMSGGVIDLIAGDTGTNNSVSYSVAQATDPGTELALAQDGNLSIAEEEGTGAVEMSGDAVINVAANVFVGGAELNPEDANFLQGGNGTLTIRENAQLHVGATSPTGGDLVLGSPANVVASVATVNLQGGLLDVTSSFNDGGNVYGGNIASGGAGSVTTFSFTGGRLKVREWNVTGPFGGDLGSLVQNGAGSLLDVTGNDTTLHSDYDLGEGTATISSGQTLAANNVLNSAGAGVINVGTGGAGTADGDFNEDGVVNAADYATWRDAMSGNSSGYNTWKTNFGATGGGGPAILDVGAGSVAVDTLNLDNGTVIAGGGVAVDTALSGSGGIDGDLTLGAGATLLIELGGTTPIAEYDQIGVTGTLNAAGTLQVSLVDGFTPEVNDSFDILDFGAFAGGFGSVMFSSGTWDTSQLTTTGVVTYTGGAGASANVPEPASLLLVFAGATILLARSYRRQGA